MVDAPPIIRGSLATLLGKLLLALVYSRDVFCFFNWYKILSKTVDKHWRQR